MAITPSNSQLSELDSKTLQLLCFLAYHGEDWHPNIEQEYRKRMRITKKTYDEMIFELNEGDFIQGRTYVKPQWHVRILKELYANNLGWIDRFKEIGAFTRNHIAEYLCKVVKCVLAGDFKEAAQLPRPYVGISHKMFNLLKYIRIESKEDIRFLQMLNEDETREMMNSTLEDLFVQDELNRVTLDSLEHAIAPTNKYRDEITDEIAAYCYFMFAEPMKPSGKPTVWSLGVRAMMLMYAGALEDSVDVFGQALRAISRKANAFSNPVFNYVYGLALYKLSKRSGGNAANYLLKRFLMDSNVRYTDPNFCIRLILQSIDGKSDQTYRAEYIEKRHNEKMYNSFLYLLYQMFGMSTDALTPGRLHSAAFFQHEMSLYLPIGPGAKQLLRDQFGGEPLLSSMRIKPKWAQTLTEIEEAVSQIEAVEKRIVYFLDGFEITAIVEQEKHDDQWRDSRLLSLLEMAKKGYDSMDNNDAVIASRLVMRDSARNDARDIFHILASSGRLYYGSHLKGRERHEIIVHQEEPYLSFEGKGSVIEIKSNVATDANGNVMKHTVTCISPGEYRLVTVNAFQKDVMKRFLTLGQVPSSAVISLKRAIESLSGIVAVKQDDLDSMAQPAVMSCGLLAVRIVPVDHIYQVTVLAAALENGTSRFAPAEGEELVYDEVENLTHCVYRDLGREDANYRQLNLFMKDELDVDVISYTEKRIYAEEALLKLIAYVYDNRDKYFIEWPEGKRLKFRGDVKSTDISISVNSNMEWFTLEGEARAGNMTLSLESLIQAICNSPIQDFVKIGDDEYIRMTEELKKHIAALASLPSRRGGQKKIPKFQVGALAAIIQDLKVNTDQGYRDFMKQTQAAFSFSAPIPDGLQATLRDYQVEGYRWICRLSAWGAGACLADDMGLGKTLQAIAFLLHKAHDGASLVVMPKSILPNWRQEAQRFAPQLNVINLNHESNRSRIIQNADRNDVILCTYGILGTERALITSRQWNVVCLDEAHQIKNRNTLVSQAAMDLNATHRLILTGTPLQNNLGELWNLFQFLNPGLLGPWNNFRDAFIVPTLDQYHRDLLKEMTAPFILRRTKQDVLTELPEKVVSEQLVELTDDEMKVYEEMRRRAEVKFKKNKTAQEREEAKNLQINFFTELINLRLAACSMRLVYDQWTAVSSKLVALMDLLDALMDNPDNNVLVFSQFTSFLDLVKPGLSKRHLAFLYLDGQTPLEKRQQLVQDFQEGKCRLFLSSLKAGGLGINLTKANYVILLDPWWNPAIENQAMDRAHRLGQKRAVSVIRLISAQTIEEKILRLHQDKQQLTDDVLEGTGESHKLTYEDIMDMISPF